jgi:IPT/TIG domain/Beta-propeller repeat
MGYARRRHDYFRPIQTAAQGTAWNGFLAVLKPDGSGLVYGTYLGGNGTGAGDTVWGLALDSHENLYIAGQTDSTNFPTTQGAFQTGLNGSTDAFVTELAGIVTTPQISSVFPVLGGIGSSVVITGSSFGNSQGQNKVNFNGIAASVTSWSDGSIMAKVPAGLSQGISTITIAVNQLPSNGVQFTVTQPLFVTPNQATLLVGQTRSLQLLDENGASINNASWSFDDTSIAEIVRPANPGDPTLLKADAVGTTILLARFGDRTGTAKVSVLPAGTSFPIGTVQWEVPPLGSIGFYKTVQALRVDDNTPDLYAEDDGAYGGYGAIRALTADGQQKWIWPSTSTKTIPTLLAADDEGGAIYFASPDNIPGPFQSYCYVGRVDQNGNESWQYQESNCYEDYAIAPDGTIYLVEGDFQNNGTNVVTALDPTTGQIKFTVPLPGLSQGTTQNVTYMPVPGQPNTNGPYCTPGNTIGPSASNVGGANYGAISVSSDGTAYVPLSGVSTVLDGQPCDSSPDTLNPGYTHLVNTLTASWTATASLYVLAIHPDGSSTIETIDNRTNTGTDWGNAAGTEFGVGSLRPIPSAPGEIFLALGPTLYHITASGTSRVPLPIDVGPGSFPGDDPLLVAQDGTVYVVGSALGSSTPESTLAAVDPNSGVKWTASTGMYTNLSAVTPDDSVAFQYHLPDFSKYLAVANSAGAVSPLFAIPMVLMRGQPSPGLPLAECHPIGRLASGSPS